MRIDIVTLFPEIFAPLFASIPARAQTSGKVSIELHNLRDYGTGVHKQVDDIPFGGGPGMVLQPEPLARAIKDIKEKCNKPPLVLYMSPQGPPLTQKKVEQLAKESSLILVCGHYEGIDERIIETLIDEELSIGDYVLSGGELAAMVVSDAVIRLQDGVISSDSAAEESFSTGLLDHPHYTRPAIFEGISVPDVLLSGNHKEIAKWRLEQAIINTKKKRPDLLENKEIQEKIQEFDKKKNKKSK